MKVFLVHRSNSRKKAVRVLKNIAVENEIILHPVVLDSFGGDAWKSAALSEMYECEAVAIYDSAACEKSQNAAWEINKAQELNKPVIILDPKRLDNGEIKKLSGLYHYDDEFSSFFQMNGKDTEMLYKVMVDSSEQLIQRRQRMNAFFITAIGSLLAIAGALAKFGPIKSPTTSFIVTVSFGIIGLLLCNSWRNLINNYGKLSAAKFRVILKLEHSLSAQVFSAEWAALGKGQRPQKYKSFTSTENMVPLWFAILIFSLVLVASFRYIW